MTDGEVYPTGRNTTPVLIDRDTLRRAEDCLASCEACAPDLADIPFDSVLDSITGCDPEFTDYILVNPGSCPNCGAEILAGYWRWQESEEGRKVFIFPGTLVTLKKTR